MFDLALGVKNCDKRFCQETEFLAIFLLKSFQRQPSNEAFQISFDLTTKEGEKFWSAVFWMNHCQW